MKLDRNISNPSRGKYALVLLRQVDRPRTPEWHNHVDESLSTLETYGCLDYGSSADTDFFVIRLKDKYAGPALHAYAEAAKSDDMEYAAEIDALAQAADRYLPKRIPD